MARRKTGRGRVLLVADRPKLAKTCFAGLTEAGFQVIKAASGEQALKAVETRQFDVVVTDVSMAGIHGMELVSRLRQCSAGLHFILMLDAPGNRPTSQGLDAESIQYLAKPIKSDALSQMVARAIRPVLGTPVTSLQNHDGGRIETASVTATNAKNEFGHMLDKVLQGGAVVITRHDVPKAVLLSYAEFQTLAGGAGRQLNTLSAQFDELLFRLQTPKARAGMKAAFDASGAQLGKAAAAAARKRGQNRA